MSDIPRLRVNRMSKAFSNDKQQYYRWMLREAPFITEDAPNHRRLRR